MNRWRRRFPGWAFAWRHGLCILVSILGGCGDSTPTVTDGPGELRVHALAVTRHSSSGLSDAGADAILSAASEVIQEEDTPGDIACPTKLERSGVVTTFTDGDGSVDAEAEFDAVVALQGDVKIVNEINWCGGLKANILGCAPTPGTSFVAVRFSLSPSLEGILWAHEFGHNKGLVHRSDSLAVMNPTLTPERRQVSLNECIAFDD